MVAEYSSTAPRILGLTGPIGCGKSSVGAILLELGARDRIDADEVVHDLMTPGTEVSDQVRAAFGPGVCASDGGVDRRKLGKIVFRDREALRRLEAITHPAVRRAIRHRLDSEIGEPGLVVVDAVKLLQSDLLDLCDAVWVVRCDRTVEMDRLLRDRGMTVTEAENRLAAQPSFDHARVTAIIDNSGSRADLREQVERAWRNLVYADSLGPTNP